MDISWNNTKAILLLTKMRSLIEDVNAWRYKLTHAKTKPKPLSQTLISAMESHVKDINGRYTLSVSGTSSITGTIDSLKYVMEHQPQLLIDPAGGTSTSTAKDVGVKYRSWTRVNAIEFIDKLYKIIVDVEEWYIAVFSKNLNVASKELLNSLMDYVGDFKNGFSVRHLSAGLDAIKLITRSLCLSLKEDNKLFSTGSVMPAGTSSKPKSARGGNPSKHPQHNHIRENSAQGKKPSDLQIRGDSVGKASNHPQQNHKTDHSKPTNPIPNARQPNDLTKEQKKELQRLEQWEQNILEKENQLEAQEVKLLAERDKIDAHINSMSNDIAQLQNKNRQLTEQLSHQMHTKISANEENLENISIKNRPVNIAEEYQSLMSHEWMNAMEELQSKGIKGSDAHMFLFDVLKIAESQAKREFKYLTESIRAPIGIESDSKSARAKPEIPQTVTNSLGDYWRSTADAADMSGIVKKIVATMEADKAYTTQTKKAMQLKEFNKFVEQAALVSWKMALQRPPMEFKDVEPGTKWDKKKQDVFFESADPVKNPVAYSISPMLYHGDQLMVKAKVVCGKPK